MSPRSVRGFTLIEVIVALAILEVGLVGTVGVLVLAHRDLSTAERLHLATQAAASAADSLIADGVSGPGGEETAWGRLRWSADQVGVVLVAEEASGAKLLEWSIPLSASAP